MDPNGPLRRELLDEVLAPFAGHGSDIRVDVEDADGRHIAGAGAAESSSRSLTGDGGEPWTAHDIRAGSDVIGRVTARGREAGTPTVAAAMEALAAAFGALVGEARARQAAEAAHVSCETDAAGERRHRIDQELVLGRRIQRSFVAVVAPEVPGYDLASYYEQAYEVGGDFFDLFRLNRRGRPLSVVVADVTGKGIAAALLMAFARPMLRAAIDHANGPADALERANRVLAERRSSLFITALCGSLSVSSGRFRLANAGHEPPLLVRRDGSPIEPIEAIEGGGPLLGAFSSLGLVDTVTELAPGDVVVLYTDGVTDARSVSGERFEDARLFDAIEAARGASAHDVVESIRCEVDRFQAGMLPADDVTVVAIGRHLRAARRKLSPRAPPP